LYRGNGHLDFSASIAHEEERYDLCVSEIKSPSNGNQVESDLVGLGKKMKMMVNTLIRKGVSNPVVGAIVLEGNKMTTFRMDLKYPKLYRMIELAAIHLPNNLQDVGSLPSVLSCVLQLKNIVKRTAIAAKKSAIAKSNGQTLALSPPSYYLA
jgi:hypothetical protein